MSNVARLAQTNYDRFRLKTTEREKASDRETMSADAFREKWYPFGDDVEMIGRARAFFHSRESNRMEALPGELSAQLDSAITRHGLRAVLIAVRMLVDSRVQSEDNWETAISDFEQSDTWLAAADLIETLAVNPAVNLK